MYVFDGGAKEGDGGANAPLCLPLAMPLVPIFKEKYLNNPLVVSIEYLKTT